MYDSNLALCEAYLLIGGILSDDKAYRMFNVRNFNRVYVPRLKKKGYKFCTERCTGYNKRGQEVRYMDYWLDREAKQPKEIDPRFHLSGREITKEAVIYV